MISFLTETHCGFFPPWYLYAPPTVVLPVSSSTSCPHMSSQFIAPTLLFVSSKIESIIQSVQCFHLYCFTDPTHLFPAADHKLKNVLKYLLFTKKVMFLFNCMSCIVPLAYCQFNSVFLYTAKSQQQSALYCKSTSTAGSAGGGVSWIWVM